MKFSIRPATRTDAAVIAATGATVWISTYAQDSLRPEFARYVLRHFTGPRIRAQMTAGASRFWVAEAAGGILGFVELRPGARSAVVAGARQAEVARLYVLERFRRQGVGSALLGACSAAAFRQGAAALWLAAYAGNTRALRFYAARGWRRAGECRFRLEGESHRNFVFARHRPAASEVAAESPARPTIRQRPRTASRLRRASG